jgi:hypothetical protein
MEIFLKSGGFYDKIKRYEDFDFAAGKADWLRRHSNSGRREFFHFLKGRHKSVPVLF